MTSLWHHCDVILHLVRKKESARSVCLLPAPEPQLRSRRSLGVSDESKWSGAFHADFFSPVYVIYSLFKDSGLQVNSFPCDTSSELFLWEHQGRGERYDGTSCRNGPLRPKNEEKRFERYSQKRIKVKKYITGMMLWTTDVCSRGPLLLSQGWFLRSHWAD